MTSKKDTHRTVWITEKEKSAVRFSMAALENWGAELPEDSPSSKLVVDAIETLQNLLAKTEKKGKTA